MRRTNVPVFPRITLSVAKTEIIGRFWGAAAKPLASPLSPALSSATRLTGVRSGRATDEGCFLAVGAFRVDTLPGPPCGYGLAWTIGVSAKATTNNTAVTLLF